MTTTPTSKALRELTEAIVAAVPELKADIQHGAFGMPPFLKREPNLEDVLLWLHQTHYWRKCTFQRDRKRIYHELITQYILGKSLSDQKPELISFLLSLCEKK